MTPQRREGRPPVGLFVGLATLDVIHRVGHRPTGNEKVTADAQFLAAGGPATGAAVTFAALGGRAVLLTALGRGPLARLILEDLREAGVEVVDAAPEQDLTPPVSAVTVSVSTGERSVVSPDAVDSEARPPAGLADLVSAADVLLVDGHHPLLGVAAAREARGSDVRTVVDAGRWKPVMAELAPLVEVMACSADFRLPGCLDSPSSAARLVQDGVPAVVVTQGAGPVLWWSGATRGAVDVPAVHAVDTLGAGDAFHGALCFYATWPDLDLPGRLRAAAQVAALRVSSVGPRSWRHLLADLHR